MGLGIGLDYAPGWRETKSFLRGNLIVGCERESVYISSFGWKAAEKSPTFINPTFHRYHSRGENNSIFIFKCSNLNLYYRCDKTANSIRSSMGTYVILINYHNYNTDDKFKYFFRNFLTHSDTKPKCL